MFTESLGQIIVEAVDFAQLPQLTSTNGKPYKTTKTNKIVVKRDGKRYDITVCVNEWAQGMAADPIAKALGRVDVSKLTPEQVERYNTLKQLAEAK